MKCTALDTSRNKEGQECIKVDVAGADALVVLDDISELKVLIQNPHFNSIKFK